MNEFIKYCKERVKVAKQQNENDVRLIRPIAEIEKLIDYLENFKIAMEQFADIEIIPEQNMVYKAVKRGGPYYSYIEVWDRNKLTPPERESLEKYGFYKTEEEARNALWGE